MSRKRQQRRQRALACIASRGTASALEIGRAATIGESWARRDMWRAVESIGMNIALALVRDGKLRPTRSNQFESLA